MDTAYLLPQRPYVCRIPYGSRRTVPARCGLQYRALTHASSRHSLRFTPGRTCRPVTALLAPAVEAPATHEVVKAPSACASTSTKATRQLWGTSQHVQLVGVEEAEELYLSLVQRTNEQHVLMVLHAPWCPHCQSIEAEVESLAAGLAHERALAVVALNCDSAAARYFSKEVLGVTALPSFVLFPRESRTFFKYKGRGRDADSLLKFLNMVCNQSQDRTWQLAGSSPVAAIGTGPAQRLLSAAQGLSLPTVLVGLAMAAVIGKLLFGGSKQAEGDAGDAEQSTVGRLGRQIDAVMGRMSGLMLRLAGAKVSLKLLETQMRALGIEEAALQAAAHSPTPAAAIASATAVPVAASAAAVVVTDVAAAEPAVAEIQGATAVMASAEPVMDAPVEPAAAAEAMVAEPAAGVVADSPAAGTMAAALVMEPSAAAGAAEPAGSWDASQDSLSDSEMEAVNTLLGALDPAVAASMDAGASDVAVPKLSAEEVLRMLDEEGSVEKVVARLMDEHVTPEQLPQSLQ